ncbi:lasso peptide biosynthesis B2 protein [Peribacillus loiseleuriae]|uniref:Stage V sporulation protein S n=1 Tax=Peribacillus loiseleuriae TaxID=1679170 RepID=A0A0K9GYR9_9BACI|nr:lasso peptide biosynthesis B2 protein [Peribacillus loiseleuriae]KMY51874.1 stage V sporulation protein S [Peribacillus loiseleuriae]
MKMLRKVLSFYHVNGQTKWMLIEAYLYLAWARYLKRLAFSKVAPSLGEQMVETPFIKNELNKEILQSVSDAIHMMSRYTFWESECFVKAIAGMKMLEKRKIESTLYLGTSKDETGLIAHAWLRSGTFYISGSEGMSKFTVVAKFAKEMNDNKVEEKSGG